MTGNVEVCGAMNPLYILLSWTAVMNEVCAIPVHFYTITGTYMKSHFAKTPGIELTAVKAPGPNYWAAREFPYPARPSQQLFKISDGEMALPFRLKNAVSFP